MVKIRSLLFLFLAGCCGPVALGPHPDSLDLQGAQEEGEVTLYANLDKALAEEIGRAFQEAHGIRVVPFLGSNQEVLARLRKNPPDVLHLNDPGPFFELKKEGLLRPRQLETSAKVPAWLKDAENSWIAPRATAALLVHRTQGEEKEAPKTWRELEGFKDRLVLPDPEGSVTSFYWSMTAVNLYGWDFLRGLAQNQLLVKEVSPQALTLVAQGDRGAAIAVEGDAAWRALQRGEPLSLTFPEEGVPVVPAPAALIKGSPHPKAGEILLEFLLSDQVQKLFALKGIYPSRADIPPPEGLPALSDVSLLQPNWELVARRRSELRRELRRALNLPPLAASPSVERPSQVPDEQIVLRSTPCRGLHFFESS